MTSFQIEQKRIRFANRSSSSFFNRPPISNIYICSLFVFIEEELVTSNSDDSFPFNNGPKEPTVLTHTQNKTSHVLDSLLNY